MTTPSLSPTDESAYAYLRKAGLNRPVALAVLAGATTGGGGGGDPLSAQAEFANLMALAILTQNITEGSGAPATSVGADGGFYIDTTALLAYGPKTNGAWPTTTYPYSVYAPYAAAYQGLLASSTVTTEIASGVLAQLKQQSASVQNANYTLTSADAGTVVEMVSASSVTVTVPTAAASGLSPGEVIYVAALGSGAVTLAPAAGVTLLSASGLVVSSYETAALRMRDTDDWVVTGIPLVGGGSTDLSAYDTIAARSTAITAALAPYETANQVSSAIAAALASVGGTLLSGVGAPGAQTGSVGQFYTDTASGSIYGPKVPVISVVGQSVTAYGSGPGYSSDISFASFQVSTQTQVSDIDLGVNAGGNTVGTSTQVGVVSGYTVGQDITQATYVIPLTHITTPSSSVSAPARAHLSSPVTLQPGVTYWFVVQPGGSDAMQFAYQGAPYAGGTPTGVVTSLGTTIYRTATGSQPYGPAQTGGPSTTLAFGLVSPNGSAWPGSPLPLETVTQANAAIAAALTSYEPTSAINAAIATAVASAGGGSSGDTVWTDLAYSNGWAPQAYGDRGGYRKDAQGYVHLRGTIISGSDAQVAFTLPVGYRPENEADFQPLTSSRTGYIAVLPDGTVTPHGGGSYLCLDGISFYAGPGAAIPVGAGDSAWTPVTAFSAPYASAGAATYGDPAYRKDAMGFVHMRGLLNQGTGAPGSVILTLPAGYRPNTNQVFSLPTSTSTMNVEIDSNGQMVLSTSGSGTPDLSPISFYAGPGLPTITPVGDTAWTVPTLVNAWVNRTDTDWQPAGFRRLSSGLVLLRGQLRGGADNQTPFQLDLPVGYRPAHNMLLSTIRGDGTNDYATYVMVGPDGSIIPEKAAGGAGYLSLDGLTFYAEQ